MSALWGDLRYAARMLLKNPGFALVAVATLALGIGANTTMFSVVNAVLLRPLPYPEASRLVGFSTNQSGPDFEDFSRELRLLSKLGGAQVWPLDYTGGPEPEKIQSAIVTGNTFDLFGAKAAFGRTISALDDRPGADPVVVLSHGFWKRTLGGDSAVLGRSLWLGGRPYTVVGVMPAQFEMPRVHAEMWLAFHIVAAEAAPYRGAHVLRAFGRLAPGATLAAARAELDAAAARLKRLHPEEDQEQTFALVPLQEQLVAGSRPTVLLLLGAVAVVLLVACANFANLLLSRSARRSRELAIRSALGAGRGRLIRQLVTESLLLSLAGGSVGILLAAWAQDLAVQLPPSSGLPGEAHLDSRVLLFALAVSTLTGILFGLLPALAMSRAARGAAHAPRGAASRQESRVSRALVVWEIAIALALLNGAGLLFKGLSRLQSVDPGFSTDHLLTFHLELPAARYQEIPPQTRVFRAALEKISAIPGVRGAALISELPLQGSPLDHNIVVEGGPAYAPGSEPSAYTRTVSPGYFRVMGIGQIRGRDFNDSDREGTALVAVVNESLVKEFLPGRDPIGARVRWARGPSSAWMTIVGVSRDVRHRSLAEPDGPAVYTPYSQKLQAWKRWTSVVVRTDGDPSRWIAPVKSAMRAVEPGLPLTELATMEEVVNSATSTPARRNFVIGLFASVALALALIGVYGVISQAVARRTQEIGVRIALGARSHDVFRLVLRQGLTLAAAGLVLGTAIGIGLARLFLSDLLFQVRVIDPAIFVTAALALLAATLLASCLPALRAVRVDPIVALRTE